MRIVFDANLLVRAAACPGGLAGKLLTLAEDGPAHSILIFPALLLEVADVLSRPRLQKRWPLSDAYIREFGRFLVRIGEDVSATTPLPPAIRDPKDQAVVEAAVAGRADVLCTNDAHFFEPAVVEFLSQYNIVVLTDLSLLALLEPAARA